MRNSTNSVASVGYAAAYAFGFTFVACVVLGVVISSLVPSASEVSENVQVQPDGTPLIMSYPLGNYGDYADQTFRTLAGKQVEVPPDAKWLAGSGLQLPGRHRQDGWDSWSDRILSANDGRRPAGYWYFVYEPEHDERGYFIGIDSRSRRTMGYLGVRGFSRIVPDRDDQFFIARDVFSRGWGVGIASAASFNSAGIPDNRASDGTLPAFNVYLISGNSLIEVNLQERTIRRLLESDELLSIAVITRGTQTQSKEGDEIILRRPKQYLALRYPECVDLIDPMGEEPVPIASYPIPDDMQNTGDSRRFRPTLTAYLTETETLVYQATMNPTSIEEGTNYRMAWIEPDGNSRKTEQFELGRSNFKFAWLALAPPVVGTVVSCFVAGTLVEGMKSTGLASGYLQALSLVFEYGWAALLSTIFSSCLAVWFCYRRQKRYGVEGGGGWLVFVAILGLPGLLGYIWSQRWPPLIRCPECGNLASQAYVDCHVCREKFAPAPLLGTEVFA